MENVTCVLGKKIVYYGKISVHTKHSGADCKNSGKITDIPNEITIYRF